MGIIGWVGGGYMHSVASMVPVIDGLFFSLHVSLPLYVYTCTYMYNDHVQYWSCIYSLNLNQALNLPASDEYVKMYTCREEE